MASRNFNIKTTLSEKFGIAGAIIFIAFILLAIFGWIANIFKLIGLLDGGFTAWLAARALGIFVAPLGAILGWF